MQKTSRIWSAVTAKSRLLTNAVQLSLAVDRPVLAAPVCWPPWESARWLWESAAPGSASSTVNQPSSPLFTATSGVLRRRTPACFSVEVRYNGAGWLQQQHEIIRNMLKVTCPIAEVLIRHVYSSFAAAFVAFVHSCYNQPETCMKFRNPKLCCASTIFRIYHISPSLCHVRPVAMVYRRHDKQRIRADMGQPCGIILYRYILSICLFLSTVCLLST